MYILITSFCYWNVQYTYLWCSPCADIAHKLEIPHIRILQHNTHTHTHTHTHIISSVYTCVCTTVCMLSACVNTCTPVLACLVYWHTRNICKIHQKFNMRECERVTQFSSRCQQSMAQTIANVTLSTLYLLHVMSLVIFP